VHVVSCRCLVVASSPRHRPAERAAAGAAAAAAREGAYLQDEHLHLLNLVVDICGVHGGGWDGRHTDGPTAAALTPRRRRPRQQAASNSRAAASHFDRKPTNARQRDTSRRTTQYNDTIMERCLVKFHFGISRTARRRAARKNGWEALLQGSSVLPCDLVCRVNREESMQAAARRRVFIVSDLSVLRYFPWRCD
jgi:hypothetical protein